MENYTSLGMAFQAMTHLWKFYLGKSHNPGKGIGESHIALGMSCGELQWLLLLLLLLLASLLDVPSQDLGFRKSRHEQKMRACWQSRRPRGCCNCCFTFVVFGSTQPRGGFEERTSWENDSRVLPLRILAPLLLLLMLAWFLDAPKQSLGFDEIRHKKKCDCEPSKRPRSCGDC